MNFQHPVSIILDLTSAAVGIMLFFAIIKMLRVDNFSWDVGMLLLVAVGLGYHVRLSGWFRNLLDYCVARISGFIALGLPLQF